jgi:hypothetical protein
MGGATAEEKAEKDAQERRALLIVGLLFLWKFVLLSCRET